MDEVPWMVLVAWTHRSAQKLADRYRASDYDALE